MGVDTMGAEEEPLRSQVVRWSGGPRGQEREALAVQLSALSA